MAYSIAYDKRVAGNMRVHILDITADAATQSVDTHLDYIHGFSIGVKSITTSFYMMQENVDSTGSASNGVIGTSGMTSGDEYFIIAYGK